jgi:molybdopterin converting factor small subunit
MNRPALRVLLLGPLHYALQAREYEMPCPPNGSQQVFWELLKEQFPRLRESFPIIRLARNGQFLQPEELIEPGDEIALIPPVSGG